MRISSSEFYQQAVTAIDQQQSTLSQVQSEMSSGLQVQTAADNPVAEGQILSVNQAISSNTQWQANANSVTASLGLESTALSTVTSALDQIQTLATQANSAGLTGSDRTAIANQMQQQLNQILSAANSTDANGAYIFGGTQSSAAPFSQAGSSVTYNGNSGVNQVAVGASSELASSDPGDAVFMQLMSGNGQLSVSSSAGNTGSASVSGASVTNPSLYAAGTYTISFSGGNYTVTDASNNQIATGSYAAGSAIQFAGISVTLNGTPASGDSVTVAPSSSQSLFTTVQNLISAVANPGTTTAAKAASNTALYNAQTALSGAQDHINLVAAGVGSRQQAASNALSTLQAQSTAFSTRLMNLQDLDYAQATTQLSQTQTTLQAAEQAYVQIQGLSLFNYIK